MRSRDRSGPSWALAALLLLFAGMNLWSTFARSTIPVALHGRVERLDGLREKKPGVDDVWMLSLDGERFQIDAALARRLEGRPNVSKAAWSTVLTVDGREVALAPSPDARGMWLAMPVLALLALALLRRGASVDGPGS